VALWHQRDDAPQHIVTWGAYRRIRHPFYAAFLLILAGAFLFAPSLGTAATLAFGALQLNRTAAGEERRLAASAFGADYRTYVARTGRFLPRLGGAA
jgi:protein-S-isoprenylcysteine O-methyltransferase Ste14